jgi:DNA-binding CsgD family transcriptional regulator
MVRRRNKNMSGLANVKKCGATLAGGHPAQLRDEAAAMRSQRPEAKRPRCETVEQLLARGIVLLTKPQMAAALQISLRSLNGLMARGEIAFFRIGPRLVRFRLEDALKRMNQTVLVREED